jgi:MoaA/NifB/PqqE/SkfB family radical SAM enzyme
VSRTGYIQVTRECCQDCRFCSNPPQDLHLDLRKGKELVDHFRQKGCTGLIFTGGEPTLSPILPQLIEYASGLDFPHRIITNAQKISDAGFFKSLYDAGLRNLNISLYSVRDDVQTFLSGNSDSLRNIHAALAVLGEYPDVQVVINTVINAYNSDHLSENVKTIIREAPFVRHFVWNNLDPRNSKVEKYPDTVSRLNAFQLELSDAVSMAIDSGRTCRVERVPLCYMAGFEHLSTETRKIVKHEFTSTYFLDKKGLIFQNEFNYGKAECCRACLLDQICAGLFEMDVFYYSEELYACFIEPDSVIQKIVAPPAASAGRGRRLKSKDK